MTTTDVGWNAAAASQNMFTTIKTSDTSPIRIDFVPNLPLGLTIAPGKKGRSLVSEGTVWDRDLESDLERLRDHYGVHRVVSLLEEDELEMLRIADLRERVRKNGMKSEWFPIRDGHVPTEKGAFSALVRTVLSALKTGERVVVHCRGGLGRAGTVAACCLVALGHEPEDAIDLVRQAREGAIENASQERFVQEFAEFWSNVGRKHAEPVE